MREPRVTVWSIFVSVGVSILTVKGGGLADDGPEAGAGLVAAGDLSLAHSVGGPSRLPLPA